MQGFGTGKRKQPCFIMGSRVLGKHETNIYLKKKNICNIIPQDRHGDLWWNAVNKVIMINLITLT